MRFILSQQVVTLVVSTDLDTATYGVDRRRYTETCVKLDRSRKTHQAVCDVKSVEIPANVSACVTSSSSYHSKGVPSLEKLVEAKYN